MYAINETQLLCYACKTATMVGNLLNCHVLSMQQRWRGFGLVLSVPVTISSRSISLQRRGYPPCQSCPASREGSLCFSSGLASGDHFDEMGNRPPGYTSSLNKGETVNTISTASPVKLHLHQIFSLRKEEVRNFQIANYYMVLFR